MNYKSIYNNALTYEAYVALLGENQSLHELHFKKFSIDEENGRKIAGFQPCRILILTEPWCGDSLALVPIIRKISELNEQWQIRVILRDENLDIMNQFLTKGVRGIPKFLFFDAQFRLIFDWGPRPQGAAEIFESNRNELKQGKIEKKDVIKKIRVYYAKDRGVSTFAELMSVFDENNLGKDIDD